MVSEPLTPSDVLACEHCGTGYILPPMTTELPQTCPNCLRDTLSPVEDATTLLDYRPEAVIPFALDQERLTGLLTAFMQPLPFKPLDLNLENLMRRVQKVFVPVWWVDAEVQAMWQAEAGFDYEVVSHREQYGGGANSGMGNVNLNVGGFNINLGEIAALAEANSTGNLSSSPSMRGGAWNTQQVKETRIRWEPRVGQLQKRYENIPASALNDDADFKAQMGRFRLEDSQPYAPTLTASALVRLPQRPPQDAWTEAEMGLMRAAQSDCQEASGANHLRGFQWTPEFSGQHWTQILLPVYVTYYIGPDRQRHWVMLNGQTGQVAGEKRAAMPLALARSIRLGLVAFALFVAGVIAAFLIEPLAYILMLMCLGMCMAAVIPYWQAWSFNRQQKRDSDGALT